MRVLAVILGIYFWGAILSSPYFWAKRVDRSLAPIVRRTLALAYGFTWPYAVYKYFASRRSPTQLGAGSLTTSPTSPSSNPFRGQSAAPGAPDDVRPTNNPFRD